MLVLDYLLCFLDLADGPATCEDHDSLDELSVVVDFEEPGGDESHEATREEGYEAVAEARQQQEGADERHGVHEESVV